MSDTHEVMTTLILVVTVLFFLELTEWLPSKCCCGVCACHIDVVVSSRDLCSCRVRIERMHFCLCYTSWLVLKQKTVYMRLYAEFVRQRQKLEDDKKRNLELYQEKLERDKTSISKVRHSE